MFQDMKRDRYRHTPGVNSDVRSKWVHATRIVDSILATDNRVSEI
jgi:hypothetical protein